MWWFKKKLKCEHDWHELETRVDKEYHHSGLGVDCEEYENTYLYCPRCDTRKVVRSYEWSLIKKAQEIKKEYLSKI